MMPLFAALTIERDPYTFGDLPGLAQAWLQDAGGFLLIGALVYLLISLTRPQAVPQEDGEKRGGSVAMLFCAAAAILAFSLYILLHLASIGTDPLNEKPPPDPTGYVKTVTPKWSLSGYKMAEVPRYATWPKGATPETVHYPWQSLVLTLGGLLSLFSILIPFGFGVVKLRFRRIWAITTLAIKEVVRSRIIVLFLLVLLVLLVPLKWFSPPKAENELLMDIQITGGILLPLLMLAGAVLVSSFALPTDVKNQNIYTTVTKPIERFELVLGRFLGYAILFSVAIFTMSSLSLVILLASNPNERALEKTGTARVPVRGTLSFQSRRGEIEGIDVGREFNYRKHIGGDPKSSQRGVYSFRKIPGGLASSANDAVPIEFSFDIYRLTKGEENRGVDVNVRVVSWQNVQQPPSMTDPQGTEWKWTDAAAYAAYRTEALAELKQIPAYSGLDKEDAATNILRVAQPPAASDSETVKSTWAVANKLAAKYGFFEFVGKEIFDFQTDRIYVPAGLFRNAIAETSADGTKKRGDSSTPLVVATVHCTTTSQMLGMAEGDLYLLQARQPFFLNYLKMAFGIWCLVLIAVGLAVALSTYLDAVVTLLAVLFLFVLGLCSGFIYELSQNIGKTNGQSGPFVSLNQLAQAKQPTAQPTGTTVEKVADTLDLAFRWVFRRIISVLPDIDAFRWTDYVAEGFDIPLEAMGMNVLVLLAYLFPWFALSYFLIRGREIAA